MNCKDFKTRMPFNYSRLSFCGWWTCFVKYAVWDHFIFRESKMGYMYLKRFVNASRGNSLHFNGICLETIWHIYSVPPLTASYKNKISLSCDTKASDCVLYNHFQKRKFATFCPKYMYDQKFCPTFVKKVNSWIRILSVLFEENNVGYLCLKTTGIN